MNIQLSIICITMSDNAMALSNICDSITVEQNHSITHTIGFFFNCPIPLQLPQVTLRAISMSKHARIYYHSSFQDWIATLSVSPNQVSETFYNSHTNRPQLSLKSADEQRALDSVPIFSTTFCRHHSAGIYLLL